MDRGTRVFWLLVVGLGGASVFFGVGAESRRRAVQGHHRVALADGQRVRVVSVVDGDTVLIEAAGRRRSLDLFGVRALSAKEKKGAASGFGRAAAKALGEVVAGREVVVELAPQRLGSEGRAGRLRLEGEDVARSLVQSGLLLAGGPGSDVYEVLQEEARGASRGLWAHPDVRRRAEMWLRRREGGQR